MCLMVIGNRHVNCKLHWKRWLVHGSKDTVLSLLHHKVSGGEEYTAVQFQRVHCFVCQCAECVLFFYLLTYSKLSFHLVSYLLFALIVSRLYMSFKLSIQGPLQIQWYWFCGAKFHILTLYSANVLCSIPLYSVFCFSNINDSSMRAVLAKKLQKL